MLKEGWDVNNLYTIIPLRTSASSTLTEQTIGRGLRLPYGNITGNEKVDSLTIVSHDKYEEIIRIANDENSLIKKENIIVIEDEELDVKKEVITIQNNFTEEIEKRKQEISSILDWDKDEEKVKDYSKLEAKKIIYDTIFEESSNYNLQINNVNDLKKETVKNIVIDKFKEKTEKSGQIMLQGFNDIIIKSIEENFESIIEDVKDNIIEIPRITIMKSPDVNVYFEDFNLDTNGLNLRPSDQSILVTNLMNNETSEIEKKGKDYLPEDIEHTLVAQLWNKPEIDYDKCSELLFKLSKQTINKLQSYLNENEVISVIKDYKTQIADYIYSQMKEHLIIQEGELIGKKVLPFVRIEKHNYSKIYKEDLYDYHQTIEAKELKSKVFTGFKKACHSAYKFDSIPEKDFVTCLETDNKVLKWLRPAPNQFNIIWNKQGSQYEPDFIVETDDIIYMVEVKKDIDIATNEVQEKKKAGIKYCENATEYNLENNKKEWKYIIIPASEIKFSRNMKEYETLFLGEF